MTFAKIWIMTGILALFLVAGCQQKNYDALGKCLTDNGAVFYGAFWCPHCQNQKEMFGNSFDKVKYVECSLPDKSGQTQECIDKKIESYPTWEFKDGSRIQGVVSLEGLAQKTGCIG